MNAKLDKTKTKMLMTLNEFKKRTISMKIEYYPEK